MTLGGRREEGVTAVEFVIVAPVLLIAMLFTVGLGRMVHARHEVEAVATDAARAASLERHVARASEQGRTIAEQSLADKGLSCARLDVNVDVSGYEPGGVVRATVTCRADLSDVAMSGLPGARTFTATSSVPIESYRSY